MEKKTTLRVQILNLPKYLGMKEFRRFLEKTGIKAKRPKVQQDHAFFSVATEEEAISAVEILNGMRLKNSQLKARRAVEDEVQRKVEDREEIMPENLEEVMLDAVVPLRNLSYPEQLAQKMEESRVLYNDISEEIKAVSVFKSTGELEEILGVGIEAKRNKCEFTIGTSVEGKKTVGFKAWGYRKGGFCPIVSPEHAPHLSDFTKTAVRRMNEYLETSEFGPFEPGSGSGHWRLLTVRDFKLSKMLIVTMHPQSLSAKELDEVKESLRKGLMKEDENDVSLFIQFQVNSNDEAAYECVHGQEFSEEMLGSLKFRVSPGAFFQTSTKAAEVLYEAVGKECGEVKDGVLLDICCGSGTIGITLAKHFEFVLGMELCKEAVDDAKINAEQNGINNVRFVRGKAEEVFQHARHYFPREFSKVIGVLDPPRCGLPDKLIASVRKMETLKTLIYVSCAPKAAKKNFLDLCRLASNKFPGPGFQLKKLIPVDMFPNTRHYEWILVFER